MPPAHNFRECEECGESFKPLQWFQRFCNPACRLKAWRKKKQEAK